METIQENGIDKKLLELDGFIRELEAVKPLVKKMKPHFQMSGLEADYHAALYIFGVNEAPKGSELDLYLKSKQ